MRSDRLGHDGSGTHGCVLADFHSGQNHGAGAQCSSVLDHRRNQPLLFLGVALVGLREARRAGMQVVGEEDVGSDKNAVGQVNAFPDHVAVLERDVVAHDGAGLDEAVVADIAILAHARAFQNVRERPHTRALADFAALRQRRGMNVRLGHV